MDSADILTAGSIARWILALELFLGGQARLTDRLTPSVHQRVMEKAPGYMRYLNFLPVKDPKQHTQVFGSLMCLAGGLLCVPSTNLPGATLSMSLSLAGIYSQYRMGISYWVPCVNTTLAALIIYGRTKGAGPW